LEELSTVTSALGIGVVGTFLQVAGANWDVSSHILGIVDTFFTTPHLVLYLGIFLSLFSGLLGVWISGRLKDGRLTPSVTGFRLSLAGSAIQLIAGPLDFWWHSAYGFDPFLFTPTHSMLIVGLAMTGVGMVIGAARLSQITGGKLVKALLVLALSSIWLDVNFVVLWLINAQGVAYTFRICSPDAIYARACSFVGFYESAAYLPALFLDALGGVTVILLAKATLARRGLLTMIAAIAVAVYAIPDLGYSAYMLLNFDVPGSFYFVAATRAAGEGIASMIPYYLGIMIPIAVFDAAVGQGRKALLVGSVFAGPVSVFLDGRFSIFSGLWSIDPALVFYLVPMVLGGLVAASASGRLKGSILPTGILIPLRGQNSGSDSEMG
jgi:hypothetical protein